MKFVKSCAASIGRSALLTFAIIALSAPFWSSCRGPLILHSSEVSVDTVLIRDVIRDTTLVVKRDSSLLRALVECDSLGRARISELLQTQPGKRVAPPLVAINQNVLTATAQVDSFSIYMQLRDKYIEQKTTVTVLRHVEVNRLTWWQTLWVGVGKILIGVIVLAVLIFLIRKIFKL